MNTSDKRDFESVYYENAIVVYRYLQSIGCSPQDAEDITQETFVKALLNIDGFRGECKLSVWLCQIAKNIWYSQQKKSNRITDTEIKEPVTYDNYLCEWSDVIDKLEEPYRTIFLHRTLTETPYEELASRFGKSESWARVTYYRARMRIQEILEERS